MMANRKAQNDCILKSIIESTKKIKATMPQQETTKMNDMRFKRLEKFAENYMKNINYDHALRNRLVCVIFGSSSQQEIVEKCEAFIEKLLLTINAFKKGVDEVMQPIPLWPKEYDRDSLGEGWMLDGDGDGVFAIKALDDIEAAEEELEEQYGIKEIDCIPVLTDKTALNHCIAEAMNGSKMHALALYLNGMPTDILEVPAQLLPSFYSGSDDIS